MQRFHRPISGYIICKDEAHVIGDCIESLDMCREIVIVDSGSTDGTTALIRSLAEQGYPIRLIEREWPGYAEQKQFALDACTETWCLNLDADERLDADMRAYLAGHSLDEAQVSSFALRRVEYLPGFGYQPPVVHRRALLRLVRKGTARYERVLVHEALVGSGSAMTIPVGSILHFRNMSIREEAAKIGHYADLKASDQFASGKRTNGLKVFLKPLGWFVKSYIFQRNFVCGTPGLIYAAMQALYAFLAEAKLYRLGLGSAAPDAPSPAHSRR